MLVVVLDYPERKACGVYSVVENLVNVFSRMNCCGEILIAVNKIHFAKITKSEYAKLLESNDVDIKTATYFVAQNEEVVRHFKEIGVPFENIPRSDTYTGTEIRKKMGKHE